MNNIESNFVPYQIALDLKSIGFDEPCFMFYEQETGSEYLQKGIVDDYWGDYSEPRDWNSIPNKPWKPFCQCISAPTYSQAFKFFREKYELDCFIDRGSRKGVYCAFVGGSKHGWLYGNNENNPSEFTYEEAELACLRKLIEIVKK